MKRYQATGVLFAKYNQRASMRNYPDQVGLWECLWWCRLDSVALIEVGRLALKAIWSLHCLRVEEVLANYCHTRMPYSGLALDCEYGMTSF